MPETDGYKKELRAACENRRSILLLALINGTAILVIVAAILLAFSPYQKSITLPTTSRRL